MLGFARAASVVLALLLLLSSVQCTMACAAPQTGSMPCHRHDAPPSHTQSSCSQTLAIAAMRQDSTAHFHIADSLAIAFHPTARAISAPLLIEPHRLHSPSPPGITALSTILRI